MRILCKKIPKLLCSNIMKRDIVLDKFFKYNSKLTDNVKVFNGYINSESYYTYYDNSGQEIVFTISEWKNYTSWDNWYSSVVRKSLKEEYNDIIGDEIISVLFKNPKEYETFLL
jgi:hypothetical protein